MTLRVIFTMSILGMSDVTTRFIYLRVREHPIPISLQEMKQTSLSAVEESAPENQAVEVVEAGTPKYGEAII